MLVSGNSYVMISGTRNPFYNCSSVLDLLLLMRLRNYNYYSQKNGGVYQAQKRMVESGLCLAKWMTMYYFTVLPGSARIRINSFSLTANWPITSWQGSNFGASIRSSLSFWSESYGRPHRSRSDFACWPIWSHQVIRSSARRSAYRRRFLHKIASTLSSTWAFNSRFFLTWLNFM